MHKRAARRSRSSARDMSYENNNTNSRKRGPEPMDCPLDYVLGYLPPGTLHWRYEDQFIQDGNHDSLELSFPNYGQVLLKVELQGGRGGVRLYSIHITQKSPFGILLDHMGRFHLVHSPRSYQFQARDNFYSYYTSDKAEFDQLLMELLDVAQMTPNQNPNLRAKTGGGSGGGASPFSSSYFY